MEAEPLSALPHGNVGRLVRSAEADLSHAIPDPQRLKWPACTLPRLPVTPPRVGRRCIANQSSPCSHHGADSRANQGDTRFAACGKDSGHVNETIAATGGTPSRESSARQRGVVDADGYAIVTKGAAARRSGNCEGSGEHTKSFRKPARKTHGINRCGEIVAWNEALTQEGEEAPAIAIATTLDSVCNRRPMRASSAAAGKFAVARAMLRPVRPMASARPSDPMVK